MFLCIEKSHWPDKGSLVETSPCQSSPRFWSLLSLEFVKCITECMFNHPPHHPTIASQNRHWKSICRRLQLKTQDCCKRNPLSSWSEHILFNNNIYNMLSFFFVDVFQDQFNGHKHHSTTKWSPFAGFPILAKLFSIEGTGRTLAIAIGVVLILGFEWRAPVQTKTWDIGMWALQGACWYTYHGAIDKLDHAALIPHKGLDVWVIQRFCVINLPQKNRFQEQLTVNPCLFAVGPWCQGLLSLQYGLFYF